MARGAGLSEASVVEAAVAMVDRDGFDRLTISRLAQELGVQAPSLYHYVGGLDDVRRRVTLHSHQVLGTISHDARDGRRGRDAFVAQCHTYRRFAHQHPGLYQALNVGVTTPDDEELWASMLHSIVPVIDSVTELGLEGDDIFEALRLFRAAIHGFLTLELASGYGFDLDVDRSYERLVEVLVSGLQAELV